MATEAAAIKWSRANSSRWRRLAYLDSAADSWAMALLGYKRASDMRLEAMPHE